MHAQANYVNVTILRKYIAGRVAHVQAVDTIILLNLRSVFPDYTGNISRSKGFDSSLGTIGERFWQI